MTYEQCNICKYASSVRRDYGDMFVCLKSDDLNMPYDMDADTYCPVFEKEEIE